MVTSGPDPQGSGHSSQLPGAPGRMRTRRSGGRGASLSWSLSTPRNPRQQTPAPLYVLWARPPASSNSKRPSIPFNLSRGGSPGRHRKRTLSLIAASHLCPRGPDWPLKGLRAEQAVGPTPRFSEGPGVKPGSREGSGGWGPGWQDAEGRGPGPQGWGAGESPPASTQTRHLTTAWVALRRRSSASQRSAPGPLVHEPPDGQAAAPRACPHSTSRPGIQARPSRLDRSQKTPLVGVGGAQSSTHFPGRRRSAPHRAVQGTVVATAALAPGGRQPGAARRGPVLLWQVGGRRHPPLHVSCWQHTCREAGPRAALLLQARRRPGVCWVTVQQSDGLPDTGFQEGSSWGAGMVPASLWAGSAGPYPGLE